MKNYRSEVEMEARETLGDGFVDELDEMCEETEEVVEYKPSFREKLLDFLQNSPMLYWVAGFVDGMLVLYVLQTMGVL